MEPARVSAEALDMRKDYLDLLEKALIGLLYQDPPLKVQSPLEAYSSEAIWQT
jgi:hypothetical protein